MASQRGLLTIAVTSRLYAPIVDATTLAQGLLP